MNVLTANQREANRRAMRVKIWSGVWRASGLSEPTINALLRAHIDSNRRLLGLTVSGLLSPSCRPRPELQHATHLTRWVHIYG
jgi:hypothetical protein